MWKKQLILSATSTVNRTSRVKVPGHNSNCENCGPCKAKGFRLDGQGHFCCTLFCCHFSVPLVLKSTLSRLSSEVSQFKMKPSLGSESQLSVLSVFSYASISTFYTPSIVYCRVGHWVSILT